MKSNNLGAQAPANADQLSPKATLTAEELATERAKFIAQWEAEKWKRNAAEKARMAKATMGRQWDSAQEIKSGIARTIEHFDQCRRYAGKEALRYKRLHEEQGPGSWPFNYFLSERAACKHWQAAITTLRRNVTSIPEPKTV